jgi:hypothetical protein
VAESTIPLSLEVPPKGPIISHINALVPLSQKLVSEGSLPQKASEEICKRLEYAKALVGAAR